MIEDDFLALLSGFVFQVVVSTITLAVRTMLDLIRG